MTGTVFSIEEFAVFDGAGIRINVFLKGCPLRCRWCHNPEGWQVERQIVRSPNGCVQCGQCKTVCSSQHGCIACGQCVIACPNHLIRFSGDVWDAKELARHLLRFQDILNASGGGVTFSGGEVLLQTDFLCEVLNSITPMHRAIETCGYGAEQDFEKILTCVDFVFFDLKIMDSEKHRQFTGVRNELILQNANKLMHAGIPYTFRVPFIRGINTDEQNLYLLKDFLLKAPTPPCVEFLPYNIMAGAKYKMLGWEYTAKFDQPAAEDYERAKNILGAFNLVFRK